MSTRGMNSWFEQLRNRGVAVKTAVLAIVVLVVFMVAAPVVFHISGTTGVTAAGLAATACLLGAAIALLAGQRVQGPEHALAALLVGMIARMGVPLIIGLVTHLRGGPLAEAGLLYYLLIFYPVTLTIEVALTLRQRPSAAPPQAPSSRMS